MSSTQFLCHEMSLILRKGTLSIFSGFRRLIDAIAALDYAVRELTKVQALAAPAIERLEALELSRFHFEAEVAGTLLEAKGKLRAASNAEARERQLKKSYEANLDPLDPDGDAGSAQSPILPDDAEPSDTEKVQALRLDVAPDPKAAALNHKWGR